MVDYRLMRKIAVSALKGGTGIRKAFLDNYRFSDDLDFTLLENKRTSGSFMNSGENLIKPSDEWNR